MTDIDILSRLSLFTVSGKTKELPYSSAVFALGTFDGVHIAHRKLLESAKVLKKTTGAEMLAVWCFRERPSTFLQKSQTEFLTDEREKAALLLEYGADVVVMAHFEDFCNMSAKDFACDVLSSALSCIGTVCGFNHRFGKGGAGDPELLKKTFGAESALTVPHVMLDGETVSSSAIRMLLKNGNTEKANRMLGRPLSLTSEITCGKKLGRKLGFPTANQAFPQGFVQIKHGVYATKCIIGNRSYLSVSNVGVRPSIREDDDHIINCETYIMDFSGELYGQTVTVEFFSFLREEKRFSSLAELQNAIEADRISALEYFKNH